MKGVKVRTYVEDCGIYRQGQDAIITGGICFSIPFEWEVNLFLDGNGQLHADKVVELVNVHFYNNLMLAVPKDDFEKVVMVTNNHKHNGS